MPTILIILGALVITALLLLFVVSRIPAGKAGRRGVFLTGLMVSLGLMSCGLGTSTANVGDVANGDGEEPGDDDPVRIKDLNKTSQWLRFKSFWKNLDAVEPGKDRDSLMTFYPYTYSEDDNSADRFRLADSLHQLNLELKPELFKLCEKNLLDSLEVVLLTEACRLRIEYIYSGFTSMVTRMMPPPGLVEKENSISTLESRIDGILKLKEKGHIDNEEMTMALASAVKALRDFSILDILGRNPHYQGSYMSLYPENENDTSDRVLRTIDEFEAGREEFLKSYKENKATDVEKAAYRSYEKTHKQLETFNRILPEYGDLLKDLVINE